MLIKRKSIEKEESSRPATRKPKFAPVTLSELDGVRYLHFGTEWVQGAMRIRKPDWPELEYAQQMMAWMLWNDAPAHVAQLGLGTGALTKFTYKHFPQAQVTTVELNPSVISICYSMFKLPDNDGRLNVVEMDAMDYVTNPANHGTLDALQVFAAHHPDDVVAGIYLSRVIGFVLEPPPDDWDGIIHFSQK